MACIFCEIIKGASKAHFVFEDSNYVAILDKYPIDVGHTLVIPKKHFEKLTDCDPVTVGDLFSKVPIIASAILRATKADAFSIAQNNGRAAKQIVPHVHVHIIPRYNHKGTIWTKRSIPSEDELYMLSKKIQESM